MRYFILIFGGSYMIINSLLTIYLWIKILKFNTKFNVDFTSLSKIKKSDVSNEFIKEYTFLNKLARYQSILISNVTILVMIIIMLAAGIIFSI